MNAIKVQRRAASLKRRVFVIEDHELMRKSIVEALERKSDLTVCGEAEDAQQAISAIASSRPDLVLTDIQLQASSGLDLIKNLRTQSPALPIIATHDPNLGDLAQRRILLRHGRVVPELRQTVCA